MLFTAVIELVLVHFLVLHCHRYINTDIHFWTINRAMVFIKLIEKTLILEMFTETAWAQKYGNHCYRML